MACLGFPSEEERVQPFPAFPFQAETAQVFSPAMPDDRIQLTHQFIGFRQMPVKWEW
jgi:hypothetical protein